MNETSKQQVLEIGIGLGGDHILQDEENGVLRIGADIDWNRLRKSVKDYGSLGTILDAHVNQEKGLPFAKESFHRIELRFPHDALMYALTSSTELWLELKRLLKPQGLVEVTFDVPSTQERRLNVNGKISKVSMPEHKMWQQAADAGMKVTIKVLSRGEVSEMGTYFSNKLLRKTEDKIGDKFYQLQAEIE